jgi:hypothetical protein
LLGSLAGSQGEGGGNVGDSSGGASGLGFVGASGVVVGVAFIVRTKQGDAPISLLRLVTFSPDTLSKRRTSIHELLD